MNQQLAAFALVVSASTVALCAPVSGAAEDPADLDFVSYMTRLQYFTHKLGLAVSAENKRLQGYYVHEVEEIIESLSAVESYKGIEVANLVKTVLVPEFERFEGMVTMGKPAQVNAAYDKLLAACNSCHEASNHGFIHVERREDNPYMQSFAP